MKNINFRTLLVLVFVIVAIGLLVRSVLNTTVGLPERAIEQLVDEHAIGRLDSANVFLSPVSDELRAEIPARLAQVVRSDHDIEHQEELMQLFEERLSLLIDPDFNKYIEHVARLTGRGQAQVRASLSDRFVERWDIDTRIFKEASFAVDSCLLSRGDTARMQVGGTVLAKRDPGVYGTDALLANPEAILADIRIPIMMAVTMNGEGSTLLLELVMGFVWNETRGTWVPHVVAFHDPSSEIERLPVPWI